MRNNGLKKIILENINGSRRWNTNRIQPDEFSKPNHLQNEIDNENEPERDDNYYIPPHQQIYPQHQQNA